MNTSSLSPAVIRVDGALVKVLRDHAYGTLSKRTQTALARLIESRPALNTQNSVEKLVDLADFHGVSQMSVLGDQIDEFGLDEIHLAVDFLYEIGERGRAGDKTKAEKRFAGEESSGYYKIGMDSVENVAALVRDLIQVSEQALDNFEQLSDLVDKLGGLDAALDMNIDELESALEAYDQLDSELLAEESDDLAEVA